MSDFVCIGNKSQFAIEYVICKKTPYLMGRMCLWVNDLYIGNIEEDVMLLTVKHYFYVKMSQPEHLRRNEFKLMKPEEVYRYIFDVEYDHTRYLLNICESFDDFSTVIYILEGNVNLIWKLHEDASNKYPEYPLSLNSSSIDFDHFINVVNQFISDINVLT